MKLSNIKKAHFIGIGGIGISGLARLFVHEGKIVSGTNDNPSPETLDALVEMGVSLSFDTTILPEADIYIYSEAWHHINPELLQKAFDSGIPTVNYFEALGMVANEYYLIAVAGSHGKTTTTAMLIDIFEAAGLDPSAIVGSLRTKTKSNYRAGKGKYFIVEACEYRRDFLSLTPDVLVITNLEHEHVDYYKNLTEVQKAFNEFAKQVRQSGVVIADLKAVTISPVLKDISAKIIDYGAYLDSTQKLAAPGKHNQQNAAAVLAVADFVGIPKETANEALANFKGTWRRFEYKGELNGAKVYDDYGHHPTEIKATIAGARDMYPDKNIVLVFQSHTYSRTYELFDDFVDALCSANRAIVLPIYAAREENVYNVSHIQLAEAAHIRNKNIIALDTFDAAITKIKGTITEKDIVIVMGAGSITELATALVT